MHAELKVVEGKQQGAVIPLAVKKFLIGRGEDCQLRPNNDSVSRHHCVFSIDDFTVRLRDLGSTNGTFVNGERLTGQRVLETGDQIRIGKLVFEIAVHGKVPVASAPVTAPTYTPPEPSASETMIDYHVEPEVTEDASATAVFSGDTQMIPPAKKPPKKTPIPIRLPDPASTGAKAPEPPPAQTDAEKQAAATTSDPRSAAADIIRQARTRRPI